AKGRSLATADVVRLFSQISGTDLEPFARQYIYGTGLPEVDYDWSIESKPEGKFAVKVAASQHAPYHLRYRVVRGATGRLELAREAVVELETGSSALVVPFQVEVELSDAEYDRIAREQKDEPEEKKRKKGEKRSGTATGSLAFRGESLATEITVDQRPTDFWLDREETVFGRFFDARRRPKLALFRRGSDALARGRRAEAEKLLTQALTAETFVVVGNDEKPDAKVLRDARDFLDARSHLALANSALEAADLPRAERERAAAKRLLDSRKEGVLETDLLMLEARLDLAKGEAQKAFRALRKAVLKRSSVDETEAWLILALTALEAGELDDCQEALDVVREREVDVKLLAEALAAKKKAAKG
ncbi:MAG: hypothetical protein ACREQY_11835, partial [Candidatus Binatia bacterium]